MSLEAAKARGHPKSREPGETRVDHENPGLQQFGFPPWRPSRLRVSHSGIFNRLLGSPLFRKRSGSRQGAKPRSRSGDGPTWRRFPGFSISAFSFSGRLPEGISDRELPRDRARLPRNYGHFIRAGGAGRPGGEQNKSMFGLKKRSSSAVLMIPVNQVPMVLRQISWSKVLDILGRYVLWCFTL